MRLPFQGTRLCEDTWDEAISSLRFAMRELSIHRRQNPFARPLPCPLGDPRRSAEILKIF